MAISNTSNAGKRLLATVVDELSSSNPTQKIGVIPKNGGGFKIFPAKDLSDAVNATSRWIEANIGRGQHSETIAFMGANDIRYIACVLACHKTGYKPLLPSTRLSDEAYQHLLDVTACEKFVYTKEKEHRVAEIKTLRKGTEFFEMPTVDEITIKHDCNNYPWTTTYTQREDDVALIIHSSGTTGMPKPVPLTHGFFGTIDYATSLPTPTGRQSSLFNDLGHDHLVLSSTPFFHLMGFLAFTESIFHSVPFVNLPDKPLSVELLADTIKQTNPTAAMLPPSIIEDMSQMEEGLEAIQRLDFVYFAGAPLAPETGNRLSSYTKLITVLGSSEMGILSSFVPEGEGNWMYFEWNDAYGVRMEDTGESLYELVIPRQEKSRAMHGIFHTFFNKTEYRSHDLFVQHPENPRLWKYHGRLDDVIVLSNGEKLNPVTLEKIIEGHPKVHRAVLIGQNRFQTSLLVEPNWSEHGTLNEADFINELWPMVERANQAVPNYGRITKTNIRISRREKPFKLTPKGTTQRHAVNKEYKNEIDAIYTANDQGCVGQLPTSVDLESLTTYIRQTVLSVMGRDNISDDDDLYGAGLDSLQTIQLGRIFKSAVSFQQPHHQTVTAQHIYGNSTISRLSQFLLGLFTGEATVNVSRVDRINSMVSKYTAQIQTPEPKPHAEHPQVSTVILTGSTGSLGTYLLHTLLNNSRIKKVYCFNRSDAANKQIASFEEKGLSSAALRDPSKVEFLQVSFGEKQFGLPNDKYKELLNTVEMIIHNAWAVNFNIPLESFENPHIKGLSEFINFAVSSKYNAHLSFVSSVATIGAWNSQMGPVVPEQPFETSDAVLEQGYGESKHVAERLCLEASRRLNIHTTVFRVGQIAGPTMEKGIWNPNEWVPTLVATSKALGKVPGSLEAYDIDWVPVDSLAQIMIELLETRRKETETQTSSAFFHLMNPSKTTWQSIVPAVQKAYNIPTVPLSEWISELENIKNPSDDDVRQMPALKLLDFYKGLAGGHEMLSAEIDTTKTQKASSTMAQLTPINQAHMANWIRQWGF